MKFRFPARRQAGLPARPARPAPAAPAAAQDFPQPDLTGTILTLLGFGITAVRLSGEMASEIGRSASIGVLASIAVSLACDVRARGVKNLIRADVMAILALYFLTLFEFLFPQPEFDLMLSRDSARSASLAVLLGFAAVIVGRHFVWAKRQPFAHTLTREIPTAWIVAIFWACALIAYAHMLLAVKFDIREMVHYFMEPRFTQPWGRERLGNWKALLFELNMLLYLIPPLGGIIFARRHRYGVFTLLSVAVIVLFTFFYAFSSGTRNLFASYLVTFLIGYAFAAPFIKRTTLLALSAATAILFIVAGHYMLLFRSDGLNNYLDGGYVAPPQQRSYFVDYNLWSIGRVMETFPNVRNFLGWEIPYLALVRPIPRAIWKGKPEGLSYSIEDATGAENMTVATSFVGEAYMSGGFPGIALVGLILGMFTGWWSSLVSSRNSELGILIYASGFFAAVISMRSLFVLTTALLPTTIALVAGTYLVRLLTRKALELIARLKRQQASNHMRPTRPAPRPRAR